MELCANDGTPAIGGTKTYWTDNGCSFCTTGGLTDPQTNAFETQMTHLVEIFQLLGYLHPKRLQSEAGPQHHITAVDVNGGERVVDENISQLGVIIVYISVGHTLLFVRKLLQQDN